MTSSNLFQACLHRKCPANMPLVTYYVSEHFAMFCTYFDSFTFSKLWPSPSFPPSLFPHLTITSLCYLLRDWHTARMLWSDWVIPSHWSWGIPVSQFYIDLEIVFACVYVCACNIMHMHCIFACACVCSCACAFLCACACVHVTAVIEIQIQSYIAYRYALRSLFVKLWVVDLGIPRLWRQTSNESAGQLEILNCSKSGLRKQDCICPQLIWCAIIGVIPHWPTCTSTKASVSLLSLFMMGRSWADTTFTCTTPGMLSRKL